jgi:hypothetical protein
VHGVAGEPVELALGGLEDRDPALGAELQDLAHAVVDVDLAGRVQGLGGDVRAQRLDHGVPPGDEVLLDLAAGPGR